MKKSLSLLLAIALIFSVFAPAAFAADEELSVEAKYQALVDKGIFTGDPDGSARLDDNMTRAEASVIIAKLFELDTDNPPATSTFSDVPVTHWAHPFVEAGSAAGIISGMGDGTYGDKGNVTIQQLAVFLAQGYAHQFGLEIDSSAFVSGNAAAWAQPFIAFAVENGLLNEQNSYTSEATRAELVVASYSSEAAVELGKEAEALQIVEVEVVNATNLLVTFSNSEEPVAVELEQALVANVDTQITIVHEATGKEFQRVVKFVPSVLAVTSVSADNLKEVKVEFNTVLDKASAETVANYSVQGQTVASAKVNEDGKSVTITLDGLFSQQSNANVTIENVKSASGVAVAKTTVNITVLDVTIPTVVSAQHTGPDSFRVTFSEPINPAGVNTSNFAVNNGQYFISNIDVDGRVANVTLYTTIPNGNVDVTVKGVRDYQGYQVVDTTVSFVAQKDDVKPAFAGIKEASPDRVVVLFTEEISIVGDPTEQATKNKFYHTNSANAATTVSTDGNELILDFSGSKLPPGTAYLTIAVNAVEDGWGNRNVAINQTIQVTLDTTKPEVKEVKAEDDKTVKIVFTEPVDAEEATKKGNYSFLNPNGSAIAAGQYGAPTLDGDTVTIVFGNARPGGVYTVVVENVEDNAGNVIDKISVNFEVKDSTPPTVKAGKLYLAEKLIKIEFSEPMNINDITDLRNYRNDSYVLSAPGKYKVTVTDNGAAVLIDYSDVATATVFPYVGGSKIEVGAVRDAAGNPTASFSTDVTLVDQDDEGIKIEKAEATAKKTIVVTLTDALSKFEKDDFALSSSVTGDVYAASVTFTNSGGKGVITYTLIDNLSTLATAGGTPVTVEIVGNESANQFGVKLNQTSTKVVADKIPVEIASIALDGTRKVVTVNFTEAVAADTLSRYTFSVSGNTVNSISGLTATSIDLNLKDAVAAGAEVVVTQELDIVGADGNKATGLTAKKTFN